MLQVTFFPFFPIYVIQGVGTEGHVTNVGDQWTMRYYVAYSLNGKKWNNYTEDNRPRVGNVTTFITIATIITPTLPLL